MPTQALVSKNNFTRNERGNIMSESENNKPTAEPLDEVQIAMQRLSEAKARKAIADEIRLVAAKTALMDRQAAEERALELQREEQRMIQAKWAAKRKAEKDAEEAEQRSAEEGKRRLAAEVERQEARKREENAKQAEITRLSEETFRLEQETKQVEAEVARGISLAQPEPAPVTLNDARHPLSKIFGVTQAAPEPVPVVSRAEPQQAPELRKESTEEAQALASVFLQHGVRIAALQAKNLLARFSPEEIKSAISFVIAAGITEPFVSEVEKSLWQSLSCDGQIAGGA
jgi:hypothetical protein